MNSLQEAITRARTNVEDGLRGDDYSGGYIMPGVLSSSLQQLVDDVLEVAAQVADGYSSITVPSHIRDMKFNQERKG